MSKVKLQVRVQVKAGDRKYPFVTPVFAPNGKIKGGPRRHSREHVPVERTLGYYIRYTESGKRRLERVGTDATVALDAMRRKEAALKAQSLGIAVVEEAKPVAQQRVRLADAAAEYLAEVQKHKRPKTYDAYRHALKLFRQGCKVEYVDEIGRNCVMDFKAACQAEYDSMHTVKNLFAYVITFLKRYGKLGLVKQTDWPKAEYHEYDPWTDEDVQKMLAVQPEDRVPAPLLLRPSFGVLPRGRSRTNAAETL
jgi:hypothetical protein